jgi:hypothetical protein
MSIYWIEEISKKNRLYSGKNMDLSACDYLVASSRITLCSFPSLRRTGALPCVSSFPHLALAIRESGKLVIDLQLLSSDALVRVVVV